MILETAIKKTIKGDTLDECREKLFKLYGKDYTIIDKKSDFEPKGLFGFRMKPVVIVTYVVNNDEEQIIKTPKLSEQEILEKNRKTILENQKDTLLKAQMKEMTQMLSQLSQKVDDIKTKPTSDSSVKHESISRIEELLSENEFSFSFINMISDKIRGHFSLDQLDDFKLVERYVVDWIGESIQIQKEKHVRPPKVIIIVGPTGVGKTTTIAKMAANSIIDAKNEGRQRPQLCIVTIDTMRVGALEQLSKFGEILGNNVLKAETAQDVSDIYSEYKDHVDYIFIDTSGYSPNDSTHISEMKSILDVKMNTEIFLAVTAGTKTSDLHNIFRNYEPFAYESVIITKFDESQCYGNIISVLWEKHKSISYITDGQGVPRNFKKANIIDILINLKGFDIDRVHIENIFGEQ